MTVDTQTFVGGMNLDRPLGSLRRANATIPLAVMKVDANGLTIGPVRALARVLPSVQLARDQVQAVYRSTGLLTSGVAVREPGGVHYFWTFRGRRVVAELESRGYPSEVPSRPALRSLLGWAGGQSK